MNNNSHIVQISEESAAAVVKKFLQEFPDEITSKLPSGFLGCLSTDLQDDIKSCILARLQWSVQSAKAAILENSRQENQSNQDLRHGWSRLPPERLQSLPANEQSKHYQGVHTVPQTHSKNQTEESEDRKVANNMTDELEFLLSLRKSPNRHRRRRRRSSNTSDSQSMLNAT